MNVWTLGKIITLKKFIIECLILPVVMFFLKLRRKIYRRKLLRRGIDPDNIPEITELRSHYKDNPHVQKMLSQDK